APPEILHQPFDPQEHPKNNTLSELWHTGRVAITFATAMVDLDKVSTDERVIEVPCPIVLDRPLNLHWKWVSQTEGELVPPINYTPDGKGAAVRRIMYRAKLRKDLRDLEGKLVDPQNWGAQFADDLFALSGVEFLNVVRKSKSQGLGKPVSKAEA